MANSAGRERRHESRFAYRRDSKLVVTIFHPGGSTVRYAVKPRNLSVNGVSFLHGGFLHLGTQCVVSLESRDGKRVNAIADVVRCVFHKRTVHEIGLKFRASVDLRRFLSQQELGDGSEGADLPPLAGRILCIEPSIDDRDLLRFMLEKIGVQVMMVADGPEAQALIEDGMAFDVVFTEAAGAAGWTDLAPALGERKPPTPVIVLTADDRPETKVLATASGCAALVAKPFTLPQIHGVLLQYLALAETQQPAPEHDLLLSEHWHDRSMRPLIARFLDRLDEQARLIETMMLDEGQRHTLRESCQRLKGTAGSYGFPQISSVAGKLVAISAGEVPLASVQEQYRELTRLCRHAVQARNLASEC